MQKLNYAIAPLLGLLIFLPILCLGIYFVALGDFGMTHLDARELLRYLQNTAGVLLGSGVLVLILGISINRP